MFAHRPLRAAWVIATVLSVATAQAVFAGNIEEIRIITATERSAGTVVNNWFGMSVHGDGFSTVSAHDLTTDAWYELNYDAGQTAWVYRDSGYDTLAGLYSVHPNPTSFMFYFDLQQGGSYQDVVLLGYARANPSDYIHVTYPANGATDVPDNPTFTWDFNGYTEKMGMKLINEDDNVVVAQEYPTDLTLREWTPVTVTPYTHYSLEMGVWTIVAGDPPGYYTLFGDGFTFIGVVNDSTKIEFETNPEPATLILMGSGLVAGGWYARRRRAR
jgi:hypothetical protein